MPAWGSAILEVFCWWCLLIGVWVTTLSSVATSEMAAAAGCSLLSAVATAAARRAMEGSWRPSLGSAAWVMRLPVAVVADFGRVMWTAAAQLGRPRGADPSRLRRLPLERPEEPSRRAAKEAAAIMTLSFTPATFAFAVDEQVEALVLHSLSDAGGLEQVVGD